MKRKTKPRQSTGAQGSGLHQEAASGQQPQGWLSWVSMRQKPAPVRQGDTLPLSLAQPGDLVVIWPPESVLRGLAPGDRLAEVAWLVDATSDGCEGAFLHLGDPGAPEPNLHGDHLRYVPGDTLALYMGLKPGRHT